MTGLRVRLDMGATVPHYEQLRIQLAALIRAGDLAPGDRLPTVRALAHDLGIAPGTVARTYRDLEADGLAVSRRRTGTVVRRYEEDDTLAPVIEDARRLVTRARRNGLSDLQIRDALAAALLLVPLALDSARHPEG